MHYDNPWRPMHERRNYYPCVRLDILHVPSQDVHRHLSQCDVGHNAVVVKPGTYDRWDPATKSSIWSGRVTIPRSECQWRYDDDDYQRAKTVTHLVEEGDYVLMTKVRGGSGKWRKVYDVNEINLEIFGLTARKAGEMTTGYATANASANARQVWRNGEVIWTIKTRG